MARIFYVGKIPRDDSLAVDKLALYCCLQHGAKGIPAQHANFERIPADGRIHRPAHELAEIEEIRSFDLRPGGMPDLRMTALRPRAERSETNAENQRRQPERTETDPLDGLSAVHWKVKKSPHVFMTIAGASFLPGDLRVRAALDLYQRPRIGPELGMVRLQQVLSDHRQSEILAHPPLQRGIAAGVCPYHLAGQGADEPVHQIQGKGLRKIESGLDKHLVLGGGTFNARRAADIQGSGSLLDMHLDE